ncbi:MAG: BamA/TamA family outer membrane protein [Prevotella sp.]|nr:BamA/TamA family outer membrane protein [Prevotella sp.]
MPRLFLKKKKLRSWMLPMLTLMAMSFVSCSTTKNIPEDDQLYTGLTKIKYNNYEKNSHFSETMAEIEAALACAPNGSLFGSSYYRSPLQFRLWTWNAFVNSESKLSQWITKNFAKEPVLMSWVNPELRASVAQSVLKNHGYFHGQVSSKTITQKNPKKAKIEYDVNLGHLFTLDSISYVRFPEKMQKLIDSTRTKSMIQTGTPFNITSLDAERNRLNNLFRNNGYYYYQPTYSSYLADTVTVPGKVQLKLQQVENVPSEAQHEWYIGRVRIEMRKQIMETLHDSVHFRSFSSYFNGHKPPMRNRVILRDLKLRPRQLFSYDLYQQSVNKITGNGLFSLVDFKFSPRDTTETCDTLDLVINCVFDKPYDFYVETNLKGKTSGWIGPGMVIGFTKRNAFRGGEKLDINAHGSYEWQTRNQLSGSRDRIHTYEYGMDASLEFPRLLLPHNRRKRFFTTPSTILKAATNVINRASYFKRHVVSGELTYNFQTSETSLHQFSPLHLQYNYMSSHTAEFDEIMERSPYLKVSMKDQFIPKMRYTYIYSSPTDYLHPIFWQTTVSEAANILSLGYMAAGNNWNEKDKRMFKNPYAQFFKIESEFRKTWHLSSHSQLVSHLDIGAIWSYGNSSAAPYTEQFYVGGANSIRAFTVRSIGPGSYSPTSKSSSYLDQTGDIKFLANLEYRSRLFGNLYGAIFLDAGNVWAMHDDESRPYAKFKINNVLKEMALGTGVGVRYDLDFFVIRLDWGIGLHLPYKSGFYNIPSFKDGQSIHLAIGYPF